jgi:hypothetical protein
LELLEPLEPLEPLERLYAIKLGVPEPQALHTHAIDELRYIRDAMARAGQFSAIPGWGGVLMGVTALAAATLAGPPASSARWLGVWSADLAVAVVIALVTIARKARQSDAPLTATPAVRFAQVLLPPLAAGAVLTAVFAANGLTARLPGCWLLLYGTSAASAGTMSSVRVVPIMGMLLMTLGLVAFVTPAAWGNIYMAAGFGGLHIIFGAIIARNYGG